MIQIYINGKPVQAREDATILEASREDKYVADKFNIYIPALYYLKNVQEEDNSGVCVVEVKGVDGLVNASKTKVEEGMEISTFTPAVLAAQAEAIKEILSIHDQDCRHCFRTGNCELQSLVRLLHVKKDKNLLQNKKSFDQSGIIVRDQNKCILCGRCVAMCSEVQGINAISKEGEGLCAKVGPRNAGSLNGTNCVNCGQCVSVCPVGALRERDDTDAIMEALNDPEKVVIVETAPSVRAGLGEAFEFPMGSNVEGKMVVALKELGFDRVYDTKLGADLTVMEEATEFIERIQNNGKLPLLTSCCPAWVKYCEIFFQDMLENISSCKSPQRMFGSIIKNYLAEKEGLDKENIVVVSIMPCTAKKFEAVRDNDLQDGFADVDYAITTRELSEMIEKAGIKFSALADMPFDEPLGIGSGAGAIFGASGGVMEAALRTAADWLTGEELPELVYEDVRGIKGIKEAEYTIAGKKIRIAAVSGLENAKELLLRIKDNQAEYDFIEIMACPGGCVNGGGQPQEKADDIYSSDIRTERAAVLYESDENAVLRKAHENPVIREIYDTYLKKTGSDIAHELLHTSYCERIDAKRLPKVIINHDECQGCKSCYKTCMYGIYRWDAKEKLPYASYSDDCVACRMCEMYCPGGCITIVPPEVVLYDPLYDPYGLND